MERNGNHRRPVGFIRHMVLQPDKTDVLDLFRLLRTGDITNSRSMDCDPQEHVGIVHRFKISFQLILQKSFLFIAKPMAWFGAAIEICLNLIMPPNRSFFMAAVFDLFQGGYTCNSKDFRSLIGHIDGRVELDGNIRPGDDKYLPALTVMASKLAYENPAKIEHTIITQWNMEFVQVLNCSNDYCGYSISTQAMIFSDKCVDREIIVVAFRGTQPFDTVQWCIDVDYSWYEHEDIGRIHEGFMKALGLQSNGEWPAEVEGTSRLAYYAVRKRLREVLAAKPNAKFVITGHSLGGAMAVLFPVLLMLHNEDRWMLERLEAVHTYGQPRVGDEKLGEFVKRKLGCKYRRFVYGNDMVPRLPFDDPTFKYKHSGDCFYFNMNYHGKIVQELPNKNYFSFTFNFFVMHITAAYQLCRSFFIGYTKGSEYREGWVLTFIRLVGLAVPGFPPHMPQDYVNSTRLCY